MLMRIDLAGWALLMIALAMSFSVLHKAAKNTDKKLRILGNIIGIIILAVCLILTISDLSLRVRTRRLTPAVPRRAGDIRRFVTPPALPKLPVAPKVETPAVPAPPK